jgi:CBS domain-containing protein
MKLETIMTTDVEVVRPDASIHDAACKMRDLDVGSLPVCDGRRLVGMLTDRDIVVRAVAGSENLSGTLVRDAMSPGIAYCFADDSDADARRVMAEHQIRRLPIVTRENKELAGIVSLGDLATKTGDVQQSGRTLREVSEPTHA